MFNKKNNLIHKYIDIVSEVGDMESYMYMGVPIGYEKARDILSIYTINIAKRLKELKSKAKLVLTIHDDIVLDTPEKEVEQIVKLLKIEMQRPIEGIRVPIETEIKIGKRWGSLEKYEETKNEK